MTSLTFSLEQLRSAPPEVRRWVEHEIGAALGALGRLEHDPSQIHTPALAACTPEEALQMFDQLKENFLLAQVFFELARETPVGRVAPPLHALNLADLLRHTRLSDGDRLADCFTAINQIFQTVRNDSEAALFGFDQHGHVYIHETTHHSIRRVWEQLFVRGSVCRGPAGSVRHDIAACRPERGYRRARPRVSSGGKSQSLTLIVFLCLRGLHLRVDGAAPYRPV